MKEQLEKLFDQQIPSEFLIKLMKLILYNNILEFHEIFGNTTLELQWKDSL
jgi:hypothetical protein